MIIDDHNSGSKKTDLREIMIIDDHNSGPINRGQRRFIMAYRDNTKVIHIGDRVIGGGNPILIQSMTNTRTEDVEATVAQILKLEEAGCEIIRSTVPTLEAAKAIGEIKKRIHIPIVADIHFDYKLAIAAVENGADKIRINPGNIGGKDKIEEVVSCAKERNIPIRVGVNSGSLEKELVEKYGSGDPVEEIKTAKMILKTLGMRTGGIEVVSCPTCGRTKIDLIGLANAVETMLQGYDLDIKVAVMGCAVNGPGEAKEADIGIAGGVGEGLLIKNGEVVQEDA